MDTQYKVARNIGLQIAIMERRNNDWSTVTMISKIDKIAGKKAKECSDEELISDWKNGGRGWSLSL